MAVLSSFRKNLPHAVKKFLRLIRYNEERRNILRELPIKKQQEINLVTHFGRDTSSLIIFIVPGADRYTLKETISGGVISLVSLCQETARLESVHGAKTLMCTFPREFLLLKHLNFENDVDVFRIEQVVNYFDQLKKILIHIPDDMAALFFQSLFRKELDWLNRITDVHINIVNANILLMPPVAVITEIKNRFPKVTMTAAHVRYCTPYFRKLYDLPLHLFSAWLSPEQYKWREYAEKKNIMVVSPDTHPRREEILDLIRRGTAVEIIILQGYTHQAFKEVVSIAKWALTFGEGLDGYLIEPVFSGTLSFAVYNEDFFTEDFKSLPGIFKNYDELAAGISRTMQEWDDEVLYPNFQKQQFDLCARYYSYEQYQKNVRDFYMEEYTYR